MLAFFSRIRAAVAGYLSGCECRGHDWRIGRNRLRRTCARCGRMEYDLQGGWTQFGPMGR